MFQFTLTTYFRSFRSGTVAYFAIATVTGLLCVPNALAATPQPIISVASSTLDGPKQVAIAGANGSTVRYTTDGSDPTPTTSQVYVGPLLITHTTTLKAIATSTSGTSTVASAIYYLDPIQWPSPSASNTGGLFVSLQEPTTGIPR